MSRVKWGRSPGSEFNMAHVNILRIHITEGVDLGLMMSHMSKSYFLRSARGGGGHLLQFLLHHLEGDSSHHFKSIPVDYREAIFNNESPWCTV